jgi:hypothetical protein
MTHARMAFALAVSLCSCCAYPQATVDPCEAYRHVSVPENDLPTMSEGDAAFSACSAMVIYYSNAPDRFRKARLCGYTHAYMFRDGGRSTAISAPRTVSGGEAGLEEEDALTLAMLYANGEGVGQNIQIAKELVCHADLWADESDVLKNLASGQPFEVCDESGSNLGKSVNYLCAGIRLDQIEAQIKKQEAALLPIIPIAARPALVSLGANWARLRDTHNKVYLQGCGEGNGCPAYEQQDDLAFQKRWLALLQEIASGVAPAAANSASELPAVDKQLDHAFQEQLANSIDGSYKQTAQAEARAWLKYREAWVRFGTARWPEIPADQWRAWLTLRHLKEPVD